MVTDAAHKYILPAMEIVAGMPETRVEGFLAAGHAATVTGWGLFEPFVERYGLPVVVAGFEPLDILAGLVQLLELVRDGRAEVANAYPRCVTREGNLNAQRQMWQVFQTAGGVWLSGVNLGLLQGMGLIVVGMVLAVVHAGGSER